MSDFEETFIFHKEESDTLSLEVWVGNFKLVQTRVKDGKTFFNCSQEGCRVNACSLPPGFKKGKNSLAFHELLFVKNKHNHQPEEHQLVLEKGRQAFQSYVIYNHSGKNARKLYSEFVNSYGNSLRADEKEVFVAKFPPFPDIRQAIIKWINESSSYSKRKKPTVISIKRKAQDGNGPGDKRSRTDEVGNDSEGDTGEEIIARNEDAAECIKSEISTQDDDEPSFVGSEDETVPVKIELHELPVPSLESGCAVVGNLKIGSSNTELWVNDYRFLKSRTTDDMIYFRCAESRRMKCRATAGIVMRHEFTIAEDDIEVPLRYINNEHSHLPLKGPIILKKGKAELKNYTIAHADKRPKEIYSDFIEVYTAHYSSELKEKFIRLFPSFSQLRQSILRWRNSPGETKVLKKRGRKPKSFNDHFLYGEENSPRMTGDQLDVEKKVVVKTKSTGQMLVELWIGDYKFIRNKIAKSNEKSYFRCYKNKEGCLATAGAYLQLKEESDCLPGEVESVDLVYVNNTHSHDPEPHLEMLEMGREDFRNYVYSNPFSVDTKTLYTEFMRVYTAEMEAEERDRFIQNFYSFERLKPSIARWRQASGPIYFRHASDTDGKLYTGMNFFHPGDVFDELYNGDLHTKAATNDEDSKSSEKSEQTNYLSQLKRASVTDPSELLQLPQKLLIKPRNVGVPNMELWISSNKFIRNKRDRGTVYFRCTMHKRGCMATAAARFNFDVNVFPVNQENLRYTLLQLYDNHNHAADPLFEAIEIGKSELKNFMKINQYYDDTKELYADFLKVYTQQMDEEDKLLFIQKFPSFKEILCSMQRWKKEFSHSGDKKKYSSNLIRLDGTDNLTEEIYLDDDKRNLRRMNPIFFAEGSVLGSSSLSQWNAVDKKVVLRRTEVGKPYIELWVNEDLYIKTKRGGSKHCYSCVKDNCPASAIVRVDMQGADEVQDGETLKGSHVFLSLNNVHCHREGSALCDIISKGKTELKRHIVTKPFDVDARTLYTEFIRDFTKDMDNKQRREFVKHFPSVSDVRETVRRFRRKFKGPIPESSLPAPVNNLVEESTDDTQLQQHEHPMPLIEVEEMKEDQMVEIEETDMFTNFEHKLVVRRNESQGIAIELWIGNNRFILTSAGDGKSVLRCDKYEEGCNAAVVVNLKLNGIDQLEDGTVLQDSHQIISLFDEHSHLKDDIKELVQKGRRGLRVFIKSHPAEGNRKILYREFLDSFTKDMDDDLKMKFLEKFPAYHSIRRSMWKWKRESLKSKENFYYSGQEGIESREGESVYSSVDGQALELNEVFFVHPKKPGKFTNNPLSALIGENVFLRFHGRQGISYLRCSMVSYGCKAVARSRTSIVTDDEGIPVENHDLIYLHDVHNHQQEDQFYHLISGIRCLQDIVHSTEVEKKLLPLYREFVDEYKKRLNEEDLVKFEQDFPPYEGLRCAMWKWRTSVMQIHSQIYEEEETGETSHVTEQDEEISIEEHCNKELDEESPGEQSQPEKEEK